MSKVNILQYPNPRLKSRGKRVETFDDKIQTVIDTMFETHYAADNCAALAATQLDFVDPLYITVIDFSENKDQPLCLVNAEIIERSGEMTQEEGCMSVGFGHGIFEKVTRSAKIKVRAQDRHGQPLEFEAEGFMAKCIQHELDHLQGLLFLDRLSRFKRKRLEHKLAKIKRLQQKD